MLLEIHHRRKNPFFVRKGSKLQSLYKLNDMPLQLVCCHSGGGSRDDCLHACKVEHIVDYILEVIPL